MFMIAKERIEDTTETVKESLQNAAETINEKIDKGLKATGVRRFSKTG